MKFTQLFNWLRFKLVTPFQAMRNRLYIERDSKHRRILTNFGFTFRNSKWASYAQTNLSSKTTSALKYSNVVLQLLLAGLFLFLISYTLVHFNLTHYIFGGELVRTFVELVRTSTCYGIAVCAASFASFVQSFLTQVFEKAFSVKVRNSNTEYSNTVVSSDSNDVKHDSSYSHAVQLKNLNEGSSSSTVDKFFKAPQSIETPIDAMYRISDLTQTTSFSGTRITSKFTEPSKFNPSNLVKNKWSLLNLQIEQSDNKTVNSPALHTLSENSFNAINSTITSTNECQTLANLHMNYLQNIKIDRWLYRYSLLHRHSLHKAHDLTLTKRLSSLGFFSGNLTSNNLWAANLVSITPDLRTTLANLHQQMYGDIWQPGSQQATPLSDIVFFESSYFWVLKRFYNLNTLDRNCTISTVRPVTTHQSFNLPKIVGDDMIKESTDLLVRQNLIERSLFSTLTQPSTITNTINPTHVTTLYDVNSTLATQSVVSGEFAVISRALSNTKPTVNSQYLYYSCNNYNCSIDNLENLTLLSDFSQNATNVKPTNLPLYFSYLVQK